MDEAIKVAIGMFTGIVTIAILSVIVSRKSQTPQVIQATASGLSSIVAAAVNPIHTAATNSNPTAPGIGAYTTPQFGARGQ
jgi:uncharacterized membrane protein YjjP (DUF1212 family)